MAYEMMEGTVCAECIYLFSRTLEPFDMTELDLDFEALGLEGDGEDLLLEQHICLLTGLDIDVRVLECNQAKQEQGKSLLQTDIFKC